VADGALLKDCGCVTTKYAESYVDTSTKLLVNKPLRTVYVDDVVTADGAVITRDPGVQVRLRVASEGALNGSRVQCAQGAAVEIAPEPSWEMTFLAGTTEEKILTTPAQGTRGLVVMAGSRIRPFRFYLRGFAGA
jgi:hypothetical protein